MVGRRRYEYLGCKGRIIDQFGCLHDHPQRSVSAATVLGQGSYAVCVCMVGVRFDVRVRRHNISTISMTERSTTAIGKRSVANE